MNVLAIDFSAKMATVAVLSDREVLAMQTSETFQQERLDALRSAGSEPTTLGASALLTPLVNATIEQSGVLASEMQLIALPVGPGLFTGLRVGVVTAKVFAYATKAAVVGVNTLEVLAAKAHATDPDHDGPIRVAINAQRKQLFTGQYRATGSWQVQASEASKILDQPVWVESWRDGDLVSGSGLKLVQSAVESERDGQSAVKVVDEENWDCDAVSVARVAMEHFQAGRRDDLWKLEPLYFRPSAAEEVRLARLNSND